MGSPDLPKTEVSDELGFLQSVIDRVTDWVFICTPRGGVVTANEAAARGLGYDKAELSGKGLSFFFDLPTIERVLQDIQKVREGETTVRVRAFRTKANDILQAEASNTLIHIGGVPHFFVICRDITHRIEIESRLRELAAVVRATDMSVIIADTLGFIRYANRAAQEIFEYDPGELVGKPLTILQPPRLRPDYMHSIFQATLAGGYRGEIISMRKSGEEFIRYLITSPVYDTNGAPVALIGISHDITHQKQLEAELSERAQEEDSLRRMVGMIESSVPEVLHRPLAESVRLLGDALNEIPPESPAAEFTFQALRTAQRVLHRTPIFVNYTKLRTGQYRFSSQPIDVHTLIGNLSSEYHAVAERLGVKWETSWESDAPAAAADPDLLWGILVSLVDNALDHTPPRGRVLLRVLPPEILSTVLFSVEDTGPGIAPDSISRFFDSPKEEGKRIGLAFCKLATEAMGGRIWALGEPGKGSAFYLAIPAHPAQAS
ncbi:MAG: PAS domain-containing sensor histidine kinase [bacterium]